MKSVSIWLIVIIVGILAYFITNNVYITYKTVEVDDFNSYCNGSKVMLKISIMGMGNLPYATRCIEFKSSRCVPVCIDEKPNCECQAVILDQIINRPGQYLLG
jgi:hypothetical protein